MLAVGITGGIGSGKSALADLLVAQGATLIDSDEIAREVVESGSPVLEQLVSEFGSGILTPENVLDRRELAKQAFSDPDRLATLNAIMHPVIDEIITKRRETAAKENQICLYAIPLFTLEHREALQLDYVIVVDCPTSIALQRLVDQRGFTPEEATVRIDAQIGRDERNAFGDWVILNDGDRESLTHQAEALWLDLLEHSQANE